MGRSHRLDGWPLLKPEAPLTPASPAHPFQAQCQMEARPDSDASMHAMGLLTCCNAEAAMRVIDQHPAWE